MHPSSACTPPAVNEVARTMTAPASSGQGACIPWKSNLDQTRTRIVKRGCVVQFRGGATARVSAVRLGAFWTDARVSESHKQYLCSDVRVVA